MFSTGTGFRRLRDEEGVGLTRRTSKGKVKAFTGVSKMVRSKESGIKERILKCQEEKGQKACQKSGECSRVRERSAIDAKHFFLTVIIHTADIERGDVSYIPQLPQAQVLTRVLKQRPQPNFPGLALALLCSVRLSADRSLLCSWRDGHK